MLGLTTKEKKAIIFLIGIGLFGYGADFVIKNCSELKVVAKSLEDVGRIDLNSAPKEILISVSGIGPKLADRIIQYRIENGGFRDITELRYIKGIGEKKYEKVKDCFKLN